MGMQVAGGLFGAPWACGGVGWLPAH